MVDNKELEPDDTRPKKPISLSSYFGQYINGNDLSYLSRDLSKLSFSEVIHLQEVLSQNGCRFLTPHEMVYIQNANTPELRDLFLGGYVQDVGVLVRDLKGLSDILRVNVQEVNSTLPFFAPISSFSLDNGVIKYNSERLFHWNLPPLKLNNKQRLPRKKIEQKSSHRQLYVLPAEDSLQITEYDRSQRGRYSTLCLNGENVLRIFYDGMNFISKTSFNSSPLGYNPIVVPNNFKLEEKLSQV